MFISSKKSFEICEGGQKLVIPCGYIGNIPDWAAGHWMIQAAIADGSIATPDGKSDKALEAADAEAKAAADAHDIRPEDPSGAPESDEVTKSEGPEKEAKSGDKKK